MGCPPGRTSMHFCFLGQHSFSLPINAPGRQLVTRQLDPFHGPLFQLNVVRSRLVLVDS